MPTIVHGRERDSRGASRASIYLAATLYRDGVPSAVKIRNLSATGALVETSATPDSGALVQLVRGALIVHALVAWSSAGRCGLRFSGSIDVQQWRAMPANREQQRVDEVVRLVKAGAVPLPVPPLVQGDRRDPAQDSRADLSGDLQRALVLLEKLGGVLAGDCDLVRRCGPALQNLDIAVQVIAAVQAMIIDRTAFDSDTAKLPALRRSADQALQQSSAA